ncbi:hypothetical protein [Ornithinibacillus gellani]|uniref:hypothetical protein n=1 Tax=Ornithinibacillus gellani TaxID=2293253 RepID=UPI0016805C59|nr:hypothetical protein [Ornithinibacillus gellani]
MDLLLSLIRLLLIILTMRWIYLIKVNSDKQVEQNELMIHLLLKNEKDSAENLDA